MPSLVLRLIKLALDQGKLFIYNNSLNNGREKKKEISKSLFKVIVWQDLALRCTVSGLQALARRYIVLKPSVW